jgi:hypothetical protein
MDNRIWFMEWFRIRLALGVLIFLAVLSALVMARPGAAGAANITLAWDANTETDIAGYKIYYGTVSRTYANSINVGNFTSCTLSLTEGRTYYFVATAYNTDGLESDYSSEISYYIPAVSTGATTAFAVNSGGSQYTAAGGIVYAADTRYSGGWGFRTSYSISGTSDVTLYRSGRTGNFSYNIPLANGNYNLTLKFAETYYTSRGKRIFDVLAAGKVVISRLDVFAMAGSAFRAYDVTVPVTVTNGTLKIQFRSVVNYPIVNAIVIKK